MSESTTFKSEMIVANVESIAAQLGIALKGVTTEIESVHDYLVQRLGDSSEASKILSIAFKISQGLSSQRELAKLIKRHEGEFHDQIAPPHVQNPHFSKRTAQAKARIPWTRGSSNSRWNQQTIFRGPKVTRNK